MVPERGACLAFILRLGGVIDRDRFGARGGELERIERSLQLLVPSPDRITGLCLDLFYKAGGDQLTRHFLRGGVPDVGGATDGFFALGCGAQQNELRIGKFDGHGCTLRVSIGASPIQAPHRREPRIGAIAGAKGLPGSAFAPPEFHTHAPFRTECQSFLRCRDMRLNDLA